MRRSASHHRAPAGVTRGWIILAAAGVIFLGGSAVAIGGRMMSAGRAEPPPDRGGRTPSDPGHTEGRDEPRPVPAVSVRPGNGTPAGSPGDSANGEGLRLVRLSASGLADLCTQSARQDPQGIGRLAWDSHVIVHEGSAVIGVPCFIRLAGGASLSINRVDLTTAHLVIQGDEALPHGRLLVMNSRIIGSGEAGLFVRLDSDNGTIWVQNSEISYALSIWMSVTGGTQLHGHRARLVVLRSALRSTHYLSEGIHLTAAGPGGSVWAGATTVEAFDPDNIAFTGEHCVRWQVEGPAECLDLQL